MSTRASGGLRTTRCRTDPTVVQWQESLPPILNNSCVSMSSSIWALGTIWSQALSGPVHRAKPSSLPVGAWWPRGELALWAGRGVVHGLENVGMMSAFGPAYILGVGWEHYLNTQLPPDVAGSIKYTAKMVQVGRMTHADYVRENISSAIYKRTYDQLRP